MIIPYLPLGRIAAMHADRLNAAALRVIQSGRYLQGESTRTFERHYARYIGTPFCISTGNGYDALWLIFNALLQTGRLKESDQVLVSGHTFIASVLAISDNRLRPILVDARPDTLQIDEKQLQRELTPHTRALLLVHLYGRCAYTEGIKHFCREHNLLLIEDNAQAQGGRYTLPGEQREAAPRTGSLGHAAAHSFYPGKNLGALGDAGAVTTHDEALAGAIRAISNYGMTRKYVCHYRGRNSRMDELQAAMLDVKLRSLDADNARRRTIAQRYIHQIAHPILYIPPDDGTHVYHIFPVLCPERDSLQQHLAAHGIETLIHYPIPIHRQRCCKGMFDDNLPVASRIAAQELSLPCHPAMTDEEVDAVIGTVNSF